MLLDFDNIEEKRLELEITKLDSKINELEGLLIHLKEMVLELKISLMEEGFTKEDFKELVNDFKENPKSSEELLAIEESFFSEKPDEEGKLIYGCDTDSENFNIFVMSVFGRYLKGTEILHEEISELREQKLKLLNKQLELQKKRVDEIATERKYKELLKDE